MLRRLIGGMLAAALSATVVLAQAPDREKEAVSSVEQWLSLVDAGKYAQSWGETVDLFQAVVPQETWVTSLQGVRQPLGKVLSRKKLSITFQTSLPGAPDGQYAIIQFHTSFENKKSALETITPMLTKDGRWRVSGYYIR